MKNIFLLIMLSVSAILFSQNNNNNNPQIQNYVPAAPDVAALWKFSEIPVSLHKGTTNISIPLFNISIGNVNVPINIAYNSTGIRVDEVATQVGLGWVLNAGGLLSKIINGDNDESNLNYADSSFNVYDLFTNDADLNIVPYSGSFELDVYQYNLPNKSGKFIYNYNKTPKLATIPFDPIILDHVRNTNEYIVTDIDGTKYEFTKPTKNIYGGCQEFDGGNDGTHYNTWRLTKITTSNNKVIIFNYKSVNYSYNTKIIEKKYRVKHFVPNQNTQQDDILCTQTVNVEDYLIDEILWDNGKLKFKYSDELPINGDSDRLDLPGALALKTIVLEDLNNKFIKQYDFGFSYFGTGEASRLKLDDVTEVNGNSENKKYSFIYNSGSLPSRLAHAKDHWGYFNGKFNNTSIPKYPGFFNVFSQGADKEPVLSNTKICSLKGIIYPTGGSSFFEYELNEYYKPASANIANLSTSFTDDTSDDYDPQEDPVDELNGYFDLNDALIIPFDPLGNIPSHNVRINVSNGCVHLDENGEETDGDENGPFSELYFSIMDMQGNLIQEISVPDTYYLTLPLSEYYIKAERVYPADCYGSGIISYQKAVEIPAHNKDIGGLRVAKIETNDGNGNLKIKKFKYNVPNTNISSGKTKFKPLYIDEEYMTILSTDWDPNGGSYFTTVFLGFTSESNLASQGVNYEYVTELIDGNGYVENNFYPAYIQTPFEYSNLTVLDGEPTNPGQYVLYNTELFNSNLPELHFRREGFLSYKKYFDVSSSLIAKKEFLYDFDQYPIDLGYSANSSIGYSVLLSSYYKESVFSTVTQPTIFKAYNVKSGWNKLVQEKQTNYFETGNVVSTIDYEYSDTSYQLNQTTVSNSDGSIQKIKNYYPHDRYLLSSLNNSDLNNYQKLYNQYRINEVIQTDVIKDNLITNRIRILYNEFSPELIMPQTIQATKQGNAVGTLKDHVIYSSYDDFGNPLEVSKKDGKQIVYIWGYNKQYPIAKIENASYSQVQSLVPNLQTLSNIDLDRTLNYIGNEGALRQALDNLRSNSELSNAMISTYTYDPLIGITSITDPQGNVVYYEYDGFNRLKHVKDKDGNILSKNNYNYAQQN